MGAGRRLGLSRPGMLGGAVRAARVAGLAALLWATVSEHHSDGSPRVPVPLLAATSLAWLGWLVCLRVKASARLTGSVLAVLAGVGGAVGGLAPVGIAFPAVAVIAAATVVGWRATLGIAVLGGAALTATVLLAGSPRAIIVEGLLAIAAAVLGGITRRQHQDRAVQAELLLAERLRADTEQARAAALAERNRIGREVHDVLAHSLGALSVQLEAADALLETDADTDNDTGRAREYVRQARRRAVEALAETRTAVHALRAEPVPLSEQLSGLVSADGATRTVTGAEPRLEPGVQLALYRAAQEAISNARKHAPGAAVTMRVEYRSCGTVLLVHNGPCPDGSTPGALARSGAGAGLRGMRERVELAGGQLSAGANGGGWSVRAEVPR